MAQRTYSGAILITHNYSWTDAVWLVDVTKGFVSRNNNCKRNSGTDWRWTASSYSQLAGLTYDRPYIGERKTLFTYYLTYFCFKNILLIPVWWNPAEMDKE